MQAPHSRLHRCRGATAQAAPAAPCCLVAAAHAAGCIMSMCCSCVCPCGATRHVDSTQLAADSGLGPVPRMHSWDASPHARRRVARACPRFPLRRVHSACMACSYVCPYDATRHVDSTQLASSGGLEPVPQVLVHAAGKAAKTYPAVSSWRSSSTRYSCADSDDAMEAAHSCLHREYALLLCMSI